MLSWFVRHPLYAGILVGLLVAVGFGAFSFPREQEIQKTITGWRPENAVEQQGVIDDLITDLERARQGEAELRRISEEEFRSLGLSRTHAYPEARDSGGFVIRYVGQETATEHTIYLAEREVEAAPWWHPDRLLYRAARAEVDRFSDGLQLTYERDWEGLAGVLLLDAIVGWVYGTVIGLILAVFGSRELTVPGASKATRPPPEAPPAALGKGEI
jgi:hypothetical protein